MNNLKLKISVLSVFCLVTFNVDAQNLFFIGEKSYPSSDNFYIVSDTDSPLNTGKRVSGFFAKDREGGFLILSPENENQMMIKGKIIIYLEDGSIINCIDRGMYDRVNKKSTTVYKLDNSEIKQLTKSNIHSIRYSLKCTNCTYSSEDGDYMGRNSTKGKFDALLFFDTPESKKSQETTYNTRSLVYNLFN